jgi:hypothetical protein
MKKKKKKKAGKAWARQREMVVAVHGLPVARRVSGAIDEAVHEAPRGEGEAVGFEQAVYVGHQRMREEHLGALHPQPSFKHDTKISIRSAD